MWNSNLPGGFDKLNFYKGNFESSNWYGIPDLLEDDVEFDKLVSYKNTLRPSKSELEGCVHFFLDDYQFEGVWNAPVKTLSRIQKFKGALTPDFSLYMDMPKALQILNVYRNRWIGRFWQEQGIHVIPTVSWSDVQSFDFAFRGIPHHNPVAVSTVGVPKDSYEHFVRGFDAMYRKIYPRKVYFYGEKEIIDFRHYNTEFIKCDTYWKKRRGEKNWEEGDSTATLSIEKLNEQTLQSK